MSGNPEDLVPFIGDGGLGGVVNRGEFDTPDTTGDVVGPEHMFYMLYYLLISFSTVYVVEASDH